MNCTFPKTDPQHFGRYKLEKWPMWLFPTAIAITGISALSGHYLGFGGPLFLIGIIAILALITKPGFFSGLEDATEMPTAPTIGQANIRATYTRRVVTYRPLLMLPFIRGRSATQLLVFIAISELAKARLRDARAWNNVLYTYKFVYKPDDISEYQYRLRDIVEKGPFIMESSDVNELNEIENDIRAAVENLAHYVKNLSQDEARSSTDTVEY